MKQIHRTIKSLQRVILASNQSYCRALMPDSRDILLLTFITPACHHTKDIQLQAPSHLSCYGNGFNHFRTVLAMDWENHIWLVPLRSHTVKRIDGLEDGNNTALSVPVDLSVHNTQEGLWKEENCNKMDAHIMYWSITINTLQHAAVTTDLADLGLCCETIALTVLFIWCNSTSISGMF